jgi:hypothetical protein
VVREIRLTGKFELEQQSRIALEEANVANTLALEAARAEAASKEAEAALALAAMEAELAHFRAKTFELVSHLDKVYIAKEAAQLNSDKHKIGKTIDDSKRESTLNTGSADGIRLVYTRDVSNTKLVEDVAKHALRRYHHAREHYCCRLEHSMDVYDIAGIVVDILASSYEFIERGDLIDRVIEGLDAERGAVENDVKSIEGPPVAAPSAATSKLHEFLVMDERVRNVRIERVEGSITYVVDLKPHFEAAMHAPLKEHTDLAVFAVLGYRLVEKVKVCRSCLKLAKSRGGKCCSAYAICNRIGRDVIFDMQLTPICPVVPSNEEKRVEYRP